MIANLSTSQWSISHALGRSAFLAILGAALLAAHPARLRAQDAGSSTAQMAQQAAGTLTGDQQSAANKALCSAIGSQVPNPAAAAPSDLSNSGVISTAASTLAGSTNLPLPSATSIL